MEHVGCRIQQHSHPLREDVSWNCSVLCNEVFLPVILFVRMWVEISNARRSEKLSWVILFVRMWVEMLRCFLRCWMYPSSSSWGCELKYDGVLSTVQTVRVILFVRMWVEIFPNLSSLTLVLSSSSWGCELKCVRSVVFHLRSWSSSSWGCELKYKEKRRYWRPIPVILFVRMWVEMFCFRIYFTPNLVILFVRMWVEM